MNLDELLDISYAPKFQQQGSEAWENIRAGRFTSSEFWKLMECGYRQMTDKELAARPKEGKGSKTKRVLDPSTMGEKGKTYILQKVAEVLTGKPKPPSYAYPLVYGKETEPEAVEYFEKVTGLVCEENGFQPWTEHAGGSPDRLIGETEGLEIKCPWTSEQQIGYLMLNDLYDLKRMYPANYWQCVSLMLFTGRKRWHHCSYDPRMIKDKHKLTHLIIEADQVEEDQDLINVALTAAVKEKLELIALLT
jgi:hypothetical protein